MLIDKAKFINIIRDLQLNYLRTKICELLIRLAHQIGFKSKWHLLQCPLCRATSFLIDSYLHFRLDCDSGTTPPALKLDLEISDAVIICRHCGEEIETKNSALELIKLIVSWGANWIWL